MNERDRSLRDARRAAYEKQRALRDDIDAWVKTAMRRANPKMAVRAALAKRSEVTAFVRWLSGANPPKECARLIRWLVRNKAVAFGGYNPYLMMLAGGIADEILRRGLQERVDGAAETLRSGVQEWHERHNQSGTR